MTRLSPATAEVLVRAVAAVGPADRPDAPGPVPDQADDLAWASDVHGVPGQVQRYARRADLDVDLGGVVRSAVARHQRALADLADVDRALGGAGIDWLVVKGPVLAEVHYGDPRLRSSVDLDVLVDPADLPAAVEALERSGAVLVESDWRELVRHGARELRVLSVRGGAVDLHWSLTPEGRPAEVAPSPATLLGRSRTVRVGRTDVRTLGWSDTVVHLAVHAAAAGGDRLLWVADLRQVLAGADVAAWSDVVDRATEWRSRPAVHLMLVRARRTALPTVPSAVLAELVPPGPWRGLVAVTERLDPFERVATGGSWCRAVARSCRTTPLRSLGTLLGKPLVGLRSAARRSTGGVADPRLDRADFLAAAALSR